MIDLSQPDWPLRQAGLPDGLPEAWTKNAAVKGGDGVRVGGKAAVLSGEIRALRIYKGASEVQKVAIARELMKSRVAALAGQQVHA